MTNNGNGLVELGIPSRLSWDAWCERARGVGVLKRKLPWYVGDLLLYGEETFGEKASQMLEEFGYTSEQLSNFKWVAKKFPADERCDLPWSWHQAAAALPKRERDKVLTRALAGELNRGDIRALAGAGRVNGAPNGSDAPELLSDATTAIETDLAQAYVTTARLMERRQRTVGNRRENEVVCELYAAALDELIERAIALRARLTTPTLGTK